MKNLRGVNFAYSVPIPTKAYSLFSLTAGQDCLAVNPKEMSDINPSGLSDADELALLEMLKVQPDFDCLPIPAYWFKKYGIPPREAVGPREYIESNYAMKRANEHKDLPPIIIDEPQQNGKLAPLFPPENIPVDVINRPFDWDSSKSFPAVICPTEEEVKNTIKHKVHDEGRKRLHEIERPMSPSDHGLNTQEHCNPYSQSETYRSAPSQEPPEEQDA